ncbi:MAG: hypothetical protein ACRELY_10735 [Polyangiaceae bacterium]
MNRGSLALVAAAAIALALAFGCTRSDGTQAPARVAFDAGTPVDLEVMAFLSEARSLHHEANLHEASRDDQAALASLDKLTKAPRPHPEKTIPEVEEVLADTYARIAEIRLRDGDTLGAAKDVDEGEKHAKSDSYFRGHLLEVGGIVQEARAAELGDAGKTADADDAKKRALALLHEAVEVQDKVIRASLGADGGSP